MHKKWYIALIFLSTFLGALTVNIYLSISETCIVSELLQEDGDIDTEDHDVEDEDQFQHVKIFDMDHYILIEIRKIQEGFHKKVLYESHILEHDAPPPRVLI